MRDPSPKALASDIRECLERDSILIAQRWLDVLMERLPENPRRIFPHQTLLDHIPLLLRRMAVAVEGTDPTNHPGVRDELEEIATLRRSQGYGLHELLAEFELLAGIVVESLRGYLSDRPETTSYEALLFTSRLQKAVHDLSRHTLRAFHTHEKSDAAERDSMLDTFGRAVTHELRNRLNSASMLLELCRMDAADGTSGQKLLTHLQKLKERLHHVDHVVEDVFAVAITHNRANRDDRAYRPFAEVVAETSEQLEELAAARGVVIRVSSDLPDFAADSMRLQIVLINLLRNAIKYSDPNLAESWVRIDAKRVDEFHWRISVRDNGIGVQPADHEKIFKRYERGSPPAGTPGDGIGLSMAFDAVSQMGGRLWLDGDAEDGSTFVFTITEPNHTLEIDGAP